MRAQDIKPGMVIRLSCNCFHKVLAVDFDDDPETNPRRIVTATLPHDDLHFFRASDWVEVR